MDSDINLNDLKKEFILNNKNISRKEKIRNLINYILIFFSVFNFINFIILLIILGIKDIFNWLRLIISIIELLLVYINNKLFNIQYISKKLKILLIICVCLFILYCLFFITICCFIFSGYNLTIDKNIHIDYLLVLGTKISNNEPCMILKRRLEKTIEFYNSNPNVILILSGGRTSDCNLSEAGVMKKYLLEENNIKEENIITEDYSMNTVENLINILNIIDKDKKIGLCTSNSHIYRAFGIAKNLGYQNLNLLSAKGSFWTFYGDIMREFYCIFFELINGNMKLYILP